MAGVEIPDDMQGRSLVPILQGKTPKDWRKQFYYHYYENPGAHNVARHYGVTTGKYKLIRFYALEGKKLDDWELFDLERDPNELTSVYGNPQYAEVQASLTVELARLREQYKVTPDDQLTASPRARRK
jgi:arylsulfatase A-like enzyme